MAKKTTSKSTKTSSKPTAKPKPKAQPKKAAAAGNGRSAPKKAPPEKQTAGPAPAAGAEPKTTAKATKAPRARDPRLPEPGTVLQKKDRQGIVRCECTVEADGIRYQGTLYRSLSAAAMAASKDMGLGGRAQNGYLFWRLIKQPSRGGDPVAALERAWERYRERATGAVASARDDGGRARIKDLLARQADALAEITQSL
jgi:hypothetical protein